MKTEDLEMNVGKRHKVYVKMGELEGSVYVTAKSVKKLGPGPSCVVADGVIIELPGTVERLECHEDCECEEESSLNSAPGGLAPAGTCRECAEPCSTGSDYCDPCYDKLHPATQ